MTGIYLITNLITHKCYVGQSIDINRRWLEHKARAFDKNNNCYDKPLYRSMRKYGVENFVLSVICECLPESLNKLEAEYIQKFNCIVPNGYNVQTAEEIYVPLSTKTICKQCGKHISYGTKLHLCRDCYDLMRKSGRPSAEELFELLKKNSFVAVGKMFGVTDNAIRKWCRNYGLSDKAKDYK